MMSEQEIIKLIIDLFRSGIITRNEAREMLREIKNTETLARLITEHGDD